MKYFNAVVVIILIFSSCSSHSNNDLEVFRATEEGLTNANEKINNQSLLLYRSLENKLTDPRMHEAAEVWQPKADSIKQLSAEITTYIEGLKNDLIKEAGYKTKDDKSTFREGDMGSVTRIFYTKNKGEVLYQKLIKYKADMLAIDEQLKNAFGGEFGNNIVLITKSFDYSSDQQKDFTKSFFTDIPLIAALAMLSRIENNVRIMENNFVQYCDSRSNTIIESYDLFSTIIGQSSTYVKAGEEIEINAGIGAFSRAATPNMIIDGKEISINEDAVLNYKFKTPLKAGKYSKEVQIKRFTKPDGTKETMIKVLRYTVAE